MSITISCTVGAAAAQLFYTEKVGSSILSRCTNLWSYGLMAMTPLCLSGSRSSILRRIANEPSSKWIGFHSLKVKMRVQLPLARPIFGGIVQRQDL